jgi:hypothetical protein
MSTAGAVKGNYFYVAGGEAPAGTYKNSVYIYDCIAGTWAAGKAQLLARSSRRARPCRAALCRRLACLRR